MACLTRVLLLFTALSFAVPTERVDLAGPAQQVLHKQPNRQPIGNPRKLKGRFLHITDFHPDPFYKLGAEADGDHPCHRGTGTNATGYYGNPTSDCDSPFSLVNATFRWIEKHIKDEIDFVIWTGDSARHDNDDDIPRTSNQILSLNRYVVEKFVETFGKVDNIDDPDPTNDFVVPIVPTYGNNDILPHNIFLPGPNSWTRDYVELWREFIPQEQKHSFARGGWFWTEVIPNKLAVISLNTLYFFENNSGVDGCDLHSEPGYEHMEWLRIQLQFMRERGMKAFLIGHVPPARTESKQNWDESCYQKYVLWQRQYRDVIAANFFGHMNIDHFILHDVRDLIYRFKIDGIDDEHTRPQGKIVNSTLSDEFSAMGKAQYINELREEWGDLPAPPKGVSYGGNHHKKLNKKQRKQKNKFLNDIGGIYGERFSMSIVSPSVVPNYFPSMRIIEYNATGLEHDHPAIGLPQGHLATEEDLHLPKRKKVKGLFNDDDNHDVGIDKKKKKKKKGKHSKDPRVKPDFPVPAPPSKIAPPGPAYSPQTFSLLSWTQLYANLTAIHQQMTADESLLVQNAVETSKKGKDPFGYEVEYATKNNDICKMPDLTVRHWLDLAERIGRTSYKRSPRENQTSDDGHEVDSMKKKKHRKKHKKKHRKTGQLKNNELWREFIRRVFVHSKTDEELAEDFD